MILVSQFTSLLTCVEPHLDNQGFKYTRLDGSLNIDQKSQVVLNFQDNHVDSPSVLLLSLRAGGVGLNLTAANHLLLMDPAWNPSIENQCFDRIHRFGQKKPCNIIRFIIRDSIESYICQIQEKKRNLTSGAFGQVDRNRGPQELQQILTLFGI